MNLELVRGGAEGAECRHGRDLALALAQAKAGAGHDVSERIFEEVIRKVGRDVLERVDDILPGLTVNPVEHPSAALQSGFGCHGLVLPCDLGGAGSRLPGIWSAASEDMCVPVIS